MVVLYLWLCDAEEVAVVQSSNQCICTPFDVFTPFGTPAVSLFKVHEAVRSFAGTLGRTDEIRLAV